MLIQIDETDSTARDSRIIEQKQQLERPGGAMASRKKGHRVIGRFARFHRLKAMIRPTTIIAGLKRV